MKKYRKIIVTLTLLVFAMVSSTVLGATGQMAGWVVQIIMAIAFGYLCFILGWGVGKKGWRYYL